jgi:hypothetical protein
MVDELKKMRAVLVMEPRLAGPTKALWRSLSGMQHGEMYSLVLNSDLQSRERMPGGFRAVMSANDLQFRAAASFGAFLVARGADLYIQRSTR